MKRHQIQVLNVETMHSIPTIGLLWGTQPRCRWMNGSSCRTRLTFKLPQTHSPSSFQYLPLSMCFRQSMDANLLAISRLELDDYSAWNRGEKLCCNIQKSLLSTGSQGQID